MVETPLLPNPMKGSRHVAVGVPAAPGEAWRGVARSTPGLVTEINLTAVHTVIRSASQGYGDTFPISWYAKRVVDIEILTGLGITILTVGRHFAGSGAPARDG